MKAPVNLTPSQAAVVSVFKQYPGEWISTFTFREYGCANPAQRICELPKKGAVINVRYGPAIDQADVLHDSVAWYQLKGWEA